jgi:hypothetical protein
MNSNTYTQQEIDDSDPVLQKLVRSPSKYESTAEFIASILGSMIDVIFESENDIDPDNYLARRIKEN